MSEHSFGGLWTSKKLEILKKYLGFYANALKATPFKLIYIDAFAGTGRCTIKARGSKQTIQGSAHIALDVEPPFHEFFFIEKKPKHVKQLRELLERHPQGGSARIIQGAAEIHLASVLNQQNWRNTRGVLFLDPYGLQCDWKMVKAIAESKALDVFFLVSLSGIYRQATNNLRDADGDKRESLTRFLGTSDWQNDLYAKQGDMFDHDESFRHANPEGVAKYVQTRLSTIFAKVVDPIILFHEDEHGKKGAPLYALFFAISNPSKSAIDLASRVSGEIMSKLR